MLLSGWNKTAHILLRFGLAVPLGYMGYLIWQHPAAWVGLMEPWAQQLLPVSGTLFMQGTALLDMALAVLLAVGIWTWLVAAIATVHLALIIVTIGVSDISARDFGLCLASAALAIETIPEWIVAKIRR